MTKDNSRMKLRYVAHEKWTVIKKCPTHEVSNAGRIRKASTGHVNKAVVDGTYGYLRVTIPTERGYRQMRIHRAVAEAFVSNPKNLPVIGFRDGDKTNCRATNLEWMSHSGERRLRDERKSSVVIEKGIKMPDRRGGSYPDPGRKAFPRSLPYRLMKVGDSFCVGEYTASEMIRTSNTNRNANRNGFGKFATRKMPDNTIRVWKVSK